MSTVGGPRLSTIPTFQNTYSLDFDGVDDYLDLGTESTVANGGQFTFSFWIKGNSQSGARYLFSADYYNLHTFWTIQNTELYWRNINNNYKLLSSNLLDGDWHHILIVYNPDGADETIRCFTDGTNQVDVVTDFRYRSVGGLYDGPLRYIGNRGGGTFPGFNGNIDEFAVWNDDQSANVSTIYNGGAPNDLTDLSPDYWLRNGDNGSWKSPQFLLPNNSNKNKLSNYSFDFDGIDDYVSTGLDLSFATVPNLSISYWIKTDATLTNFASYFAIAVNVSYSNSGYNYSLGRLYKSQSLGLVVWVQGMGSSNGSTTLDDGQWHHIIQTYSDNGNNTSRVRIYVDGNTTPEVDLASTLSYAPLTSNLFIGARNASADRAFPGKVDEVSVWDSVLSTEEITALYNSGTPTTLPSGAVAHYKMGEEANFTSNWLVDNSSLTNYSKRIFEFDGVDDYIDCGTSTLSGETALSISAWVYPTSYGGAAAESFVSTDSTLPRGFYIGVYNASNFRFAFTTNGSNLTAINTTPGTVDLNVWQHILVTWDQINLKFYKNGVLLNTVPTTFASNGTFTTTNNLLIGVRQLGGVGLFEGKIDEVAIFNEVVDIGDVWNGSGEPIDVSAVNGIVSNWRMGEDASFNGTNWTVPDQVGTNNGTSNSLMVDALVGEAPNYTGGGISEGMDIEDRVGSAPSSSNNAVSFNMDLIDRVEDTP